MDMDTIRVKSISLITSEGADCVLLNLDLPNPEYPFTGDAQVKMNVAKGFGEDYARFHFPNTPVRIINT